MGRKAKPKLVAEQKQAAKSLGVTDRTLRTWVRRPGFPDCSAGYDLTAIRAWMEKFLRQGSDGREEAQQLQLDRSRERAAQDAIKTQQMELRLAEQERELLPRRTEELAIATIGTKLGDWCDQLPDLIRGVCCPKCQKRVAERLETELKQGRTDLVHELKSLPAL